MNYPIDIEAQLTGLYQEKEKVERTIETMRCIYEMSNIAYDCGKNGEFIPPDMTARIQMLATIGEGDETFNKIALIIAMRICKAHAQGRRDAAELEEYYGQAD